MKTKSPSQTAGPLSGKQYEWVGHFRKHLDAGHNDGPRMKDEPIPKRGAYVPVGPSHDARTDEGDPVFFFGGPEEARIAVQGGPKRGTRTYTAPPPKKYGGTGEI